MGERGMRASRLGCLSASGFSEHYALAVPPKKKEPSSGEGTKGGEAATAAAAEQSSGKTRGEAAEKVGDGVELGDEGGSQHEAATE